MVYLFLFRGTDNLLIELVLCDGFKSLMLLSDYPDCSDKNIRIERNVVFTGTVHAIDAHPVPVSGSMDKLTVSKVYGDMSDIFRLCLGGFSSKRK